MLHVAGGHELALFYIHRFGSPRRGNQQIGLPGQEGRDLNQITNHCRRCGLAWFVNIGGDRQARVLLYFVEYPEPSFQTRASIGIDAGAIGFVERGFEYQLNREQISNPLQLLGDFQRCSAIFQYARASNPKQRLVVAAKIGANLGGVVR